MVATEFGEGRVEARPRDSQSAPTEVKVSVQVRDVKRTKCSVIISKNVMSKYMSFAWNKLDGTDL